MFTKLMALFIAGFLAVPGLAVKVAHADTECESVETHPVKIEAWISKRFKKDRRAIKKEMASLPHIKVRLSVFPMKDPAKVMAIGKCVTVEIAQHAIKKALKYTGGITALVDQRVTRSHWVGIGTMLFDEYMQQPIDEKKLKQLLDTSLSTEEFQTLYRKLAKMPDTVRSFGMDLPNPRKMKD